MTVTLPSQKNVRDVKTLHLVADARISTCAVLSGKKTPSRNVRIYLRSAMYNVSAAVAAVHRLCNEHCTGGCCQLLLTAQHASPALSRSIPRVVNS